MRKNRKCKRCPLCEQPHHTTCLWGAGSKNANLFLIGEAPGFEVDLKGVPFVGKADKLLDHVLFKLGLDREKIYITNCFKCRPLGNQLPGKRDMEAWFDSCWLYLQQEIQDVNPKVILLLGGTPLSLLCGLNKITRYECMEVPTIYDGAKTFCSYHPAYVLRAPSKEVRLAQAIAVAAKPAGMKIKTEGWKAGLYDYEIRM